MELQASRPTLLLQHIKALTRRCNVSLLTNFRAIPLSQKLGAGEYDNKRNVGESGANAKAAPLMYDRLQTLTLRLRSETGDPLSPSQR